MINECKKNSENGNLLTETEQIGNKQKQPVEAETGAEIIKLVKYAEEILKNTSDTSEIIKEANEMRVNDENWSDMKKQIGQWIEAIDKVLSELNKYGIDINNLQYLESELVYRRAQLLQLTLNKELAKFEQDAATSLGGKNEEYIKKYAEEALKILEETEKDHFKIKKMLENASEKTLQDISKILENISKIIKEEIKEKKIKISAEDWYVMRGQVIEVWTQRIDEMFMLLDKYMNKYGEHIYLQILQERLEEKKDLLKWIQLMLERKQLELEAQLKGGVERSTTNKEDYLNMYV